MERATRWRELGEALPQLVREAEDDLLRAFRDHVQFVLGAVGVVDPAGNAKRAVDLHDPELVIATGSGALGERVRRVAELASILREVTGLWQAVDEARELVDDVWAELWDGIANALPAMPDPSLDAIASLPELARAAAADPASTWPMIATGETEAEVVGKALDELSVRAGIARGDLPRVPALPDRPVLIRDDASNAIDSLHDWVASRENWARVLARLARWLVAPPSRA